MACDNQGDRNLLSEARSQALACHEPPSPHLFLIVNLGFHLAREIVNQGIAADLSGRPQRPLGAEEAQGWGPPWDSPDPWSKMDPSEAASQRSYMHWFTHSAPDPERLR